MKYDRNVSRAYCLKEHQEKGWNNMTLGEKIYRLRAEKGLSQEAFGDMLGVSRQSVSKWETDQSQPELEKIVAISELFEVSTDYLLKENLEKPQTARTADDVEPVHVRPKKPHYEYKSKKTIKGIPLVHVNFGLGLYRAKGILAIGNIATGVLAIGFLSAGIVDVGLLAFGVLAIGTVALGLISMGTLAVGCIAMGAFTFGIFCMGALNFGQFCFGALSFGKQIAVGDEAHGKIALGFSRAAGELYQEVNKDGQFDYQTVERLIEENVASYWWPFREWMKGILRMMG